MKRNKRNIIVIFLLLIPFLSIGIIFIRKEGSSPFAEKKSKPVAGPERKKSALLKVAVPPAYRNAIIGNDVSRHQQVIDWNRVSDDGKVKFAYLKSTEGLTLVDKSYDSNYESCRKAGLACGSYHFLNPYRNGKLQALHFLRNSEFRKGDLLPVLDIERKHFLGNKFLHRVIDDFISEIKRQTGSDVILYCSYNFYRHHLHPRYKLRKLWMAHYKTADLSAIHQSWHLWQYTDNGRVAGITGPVDLNILKGSSLEIFQIRN